MAATNPKKSTIQGTIYDPYNAPLAGVSVQAYDKDLRTEQLLGQAVTNNQGQYSIAYTPSKFSRAEKKSADIFIRVYSNDASSKIILSESEIHFNAAPVYTLDFKIGSSPYQGLAEFDALIELISPLLSSQKIRIEDLNEDNDGDFSFLAGETGESIEKIALLPLAFKLSQQIVVDAAIFYGLFRLQYPQELHALLLVKRESLKKGIETAIEEHIISSRYLGQIEEILNRLDQLAEDHILSDKKEENAAFNKMLGKALPKSGMRKAFVKNYLANEESPSKFWESLKDEKDFEDGKAIDEVKHLMWINLFTANVPELSELLFSEKENDPELAEIRGFAKFTIGDWKDRISASGVTSFPEGILGDTQEEKVEHYAKTLEGIAQILFPTDVFARKMSIDKQDPFGGAKDDLITFFSKNNDFDLKSTQIQRQLDEANYEGITNPNLLKAEIPKISRLYKLSEDYETVSILRKEEIDSSTKLVQSHSANSFVAKMSTHMDDASAQLVYNRAARMDRYTTALALKFRTEQDIPIYAINGKVNETSAFKSNTSTGNQSNGRPDYQSIFGDNNLCECEHCQSVYSPSAYLVDILSFIKRNSQEAFIELTTRRPDLVDILLTCKNTHTPLPYIDLVNEILEGFISGGVQANQTSNTAEELVAFPEHKLEAAYKKLRIANSSFQLPLDLAWEETRVYLDKLNLKRHELMELFFEKNKNNKYKDIFISAEYLGIPQEELKLINGKEDATPFTTDRVKDFLAYTGLTYVEILQLLECYIINPVKQNGEGRTITIVAEINGNNDDPTTCDIELLMFNGLDSNAVERMIRFIRLWKKVGWGLYELDKVFMQLKELFKLQQKSLFTVSYEEFNDGVIIPLANIARIKDLFRIDTSIALAFWADIDHAEYRDYSDNEQPIIPSFFEKLFQNKLVSNPIDEDFANPLDLPGRMIDKSDLIISALNISKFDFDFLVEDTLSNADLSLENLSVLYRFTTLAKEMKMSIKDLLIAVDLIGINPFGDLSQTVDAHSFLDIVAFIRSSGFSMTELRVLLRMPEQASTQIDYSNLANVLDSIREGLKKIEVLFPDAESDSSQAIAKRENQNTLLADTISSDFQTESKLIHIMLNDLVKFSTTDLPAITPFIYDGFIESEGPIFSINELGEISGFTHVVETYVLLLQTWERIEGLTSSLKISSDEFLFFQQHELTLQINGIWNLPLGSSGSNLFPAFEKLMQLIRFRNSLAEINEDWFKLFDHPIKNDSSSKGDFIQTFAVQNGSTETALEFLIGDSSDIDQKGILNFSFPNDYLLGINLIQIIKCLRIVEKMGSSVDQLSQLTLPDLSDTNASAMAKSMLKSKYDESVWLEIIKPISNQLREKRRDALVSFILTASDQEIADFREKKSILNSNSLFEYFLIDTEMSACMMTSRIKQAISSVQLFVDRCLMGLEGAESEIFLSPEFADQWNQWRKWYRIWEANRKVFLYPENWIEPELRDDKSPIFKELENKLLQNEVTEEVTYKALEEYLRNLDTVANLEAIAFFNDEQANILHVIGRTNTIPHHYYYRKQENSIWSAWEKVELDISGNHIVLVVWNNRLMLFWGSFEVKQKQRSKGISLNLVNGERITSNAPKEHLEIKLNWSEYKNGKWASKKISENVLKANYIINSDDEIVVGGLELLEHLFFSSKFENSKLVISVFLREEINLSTIIIKALSSFVFDGCNDSPYISTSFLDKLRIANGIALKGMQLYRFQGDLSLYDIGAFQRHDDSSSSELVHILEKGPIIDNRPDKNLILPYQHEIGDKKPALFFNRNPFNNFFILQKHNKKAHFPEDSMIAIPGSVITRKYFEATIGDSNLSPNKSDKTKTNVDFSSLNTLEDFDSPIRVDYPTYSYLFKNDYKFQTFYHPFVCDYIRTLNRDGIHGLYTKNSQDKLVENFVQAYDPTVVVQEPYPVEDVDYSLSGAYSIYNWELFFHIPLLIATRLTQNQKFDAARNWLHFIFDPTKSSVSQDEGANHFWLPRPFKKEIEEGILSIEELILKEKNTADLDIQLRNWERNPFNPHAVARLRRSAYMRKIVMQYIDILISWGDQLFRRDSIESINEASLLYILAANILGEKPPTIPARTKPQEQSFSTVKSELDNFGNAKVKIESFLSHADIIDSNLLEDPLVPMFCIPKNDKLLRYWDTIEDRLFKIRNCMNIEGELRQLALFEPPIDPSLLIRAKANGLDINNILNNVDAQLPNYRFQVILQKANELCNDVKSLGSQLLSILEKKDAEQLSLLRSGQEIKLMEMIRDIKKRQIEEAKENLENITRSKNIIEERKNYYNSRPFKNARESNYIDSLDLASTFQDVQGANDIVASVLFGLPDIKIGAWSWGTKTGGSHLAGASKSISASFGALASHKTTRGNIASTEGGFQRRQDDWDFQTKIAELELKQIDKQIIAAEIRLAIAEKDLKNHDLQIENAKVIDDYLKDKFTNEELYSYMVGQISSIYFQSYQLAYELAKKAEKCYQFELGVDNTSFIKYGYWDSLKKGLLSGEKLQFDLRRLELAYLENNKREFEMTKNISLISLAPTELIKIRENGSCNVNIPELLFDIDHPGHYMRRIKSISLTIPCVTGPYTNVSCKLTLEKNRFRKSNEASGYTYTGVEVEHFHHNHGNTESVATSSSQNDSGLFVLDFNDPRYLPFEGAGVISDWRIELPNEFRQFDYNTISDVIFQIRYTARDGGEALKDAAIGEINNIIEDNSKGLIRMFSARHDFSSEWHRFLNPAGDVSTQILEFELTNERFPFLLRNKNIELHKAILFLKLNEETGYDDANPILFNLKKDGGSEFTNQEFKIDASPIEGLPHAIPFQNNQDIGNWRIEIVESNLANLPDPLKKTISIDGEDHIRLNPVAIRDIFIVFNYSIS